jgi:hypothetical protein
MPKRSAAASWPTIKRNLLQWRKLLAEFPRDSRLKPAIIYALPYALIEALRIHAPNLLSPADAHFEKRLHSLCVTGFWAKQPFYSETLDGMRIESEEFEAGAVLNDRYRSADQHFRVNRDILATDRFQPAIEKQRDRISDGLDTRMRL